MLKTKKQTLISLIICFLLGFLSSCFPFHQEPDLERRFMSAREIFFLKLDVYYKKHQRYPESIKELSLKKLGSDEYIYPQVNTLVANYFTVKPTWSLDEYYNIKPLYKPQAKDRGYGRAYGDLKTYLPTLHNETENTNSPRLIGCDGMVLYQPMGENNKDYIILLCKKDGRISALHNRENPSKNPIVSVEKKMIIYDKYYDPHDPKQADFY